MTEWEHHGLLVALMVENRKTHMYINIYIIFDGNLFSYRSFSVLEALPTVWLGGVSPQRTKKNKIKSSVLFRRRHYKYLSFVNSSEDSFKTGESSSQKNNIPSLFSVWFGYFSSCVVALPQSL